MPQFVTSSIRKSAPFAKLALSAVFKKCMGIYSPILVNSFEMIALDQRESKETNFY